jgi:DNA integrity scanning protein DisA with diadenylate cyclase activity
MNSIVVYDLIELTVLTTFFYHCFVWLDHNKEKSLLKQILMVIALNAFAWTFELKAIQILFFYITTPGSIIYYLVHQKQFQKNYNPLYAHDKTTQKNLSYRTINEVQKNIALIIQEGIHGLYEEKNIIYILEQSDPLDALITPLIYFNTPLSKEVVKYFIQSTEPEKICSILIKKNTIIGPMITLFDQLIVAPNQGEIQALLEPIVIDTDAIIIVGLYKTQLWTLLHKDNGYSDLTTKELFTIIHHLSHTGDHSYHDYSQNKKDSSSQHSL